MALSTAAGSRAAKKFNDLKDFGGAGDPVVPNTTNATPQGNVSTKQIAKTSRSRRRCRRASRPNYFVIL